MTKEKKKEVINIDELAKRTAKATIEEFKNSRLLKENISYYRKVELLLYSYSSLLEAIKQKEEDIEYIQKNGLPEKSGSVVVYRTNGGNITQAERYMQLIEQYKLEKIETERSINRIDNVLNKIKEDKHYDIIKYKYIVAEKERLTEEELAEKLNVHRCTITRNKGRLINSIKVMLFPESVKEYAQ